MGEKFNQDSLVLMSLELKGFGFKQVEMVLEQRFELIYRQANIPNDCSQSSSSHFMMVGHDNTSMWLRCLSKNYVTAALSVLLIANLSQCFDYFTPGNARQPAHTQTSTSSSVIGGGTGSS
jgi:hypothetical protein